MAVFVQPLERIHPLLAITVVVNFHNVKVLLLQLPNTTHLSYLQTGGI